MRIDTLLSKAGYGSRKQIRRLFQKRLVQVDGSIVLAENQNIDPQLHKVTVAGKRVEADEEHIYLMLHKPGGVVTALKDRENRTVLDLLQENDRSPHVMHVGRLDKDTEGLMLLTDNGQLAYQLVIPDKHVRKRYKVKVNGLLTAADQQSFAEGIVFEGGERCKPADLQILEAGEKESLAYLDIYEGKFHQVKKMFLAVGKKVTYLQRTEMGPLRLDERLAPGEYRPLTREELELLKPYFTAHTK